MTYRFSLIIIVIASAGWTAAHDTAPEEASADQRTNIQLVSQFLDGQFVDDGPTEGGMSRAERREERIALRGRRRATVSGQSQGSKHTIHHPLQPRVPNGPWAGTKPPEDSAPAPAPPAAANPESLPAASSPPTGAEKAASTAPRGEEQKADGTTDPPDVDGQDVDGQEDSSGKEASTLPPHLQKLQAKIKTARDIYRNRMLNTAEHCHWSIMHSLIAYGVEKQVRIGSPHGKPVNAIGWICYNYPCRGENLFYLDQEKIRGRQGPGRQGHEGQFLAMLAQSRVNINYPMKVQGRDLSVKDLVRSEMASCRAGTELTFKLIGLAHYLDIDKIWTCERGSRWNIERMMAEEIRQPINGAACGGTHRLFGLAYGVRQRRKSDPELSGTFARAERYLTQYHQYTFHLQNRDGSFSTEFFVGRGFDSDWKKRILTSGHVAEWLAFSLPADQLHRPEMVRAIHYL
ncbi:MAG: hypothetical protein GTO76_09365, partial [Planctomycetales bacterium]|nr:hypothetical protein [Planctomycetales bacterium]NIN08846.1 hypothetical protein [Planctomycetales bacterium]NIN77963.1 hypothetical protein [Planctomycetales bacterium]NIO35146.1 hypothetical protein [Planctomycetales bacterium]NIO46901.1 hypothetical protein [Planctomycetales bacterium]